MTSTEVLSNIERAHARPLPMIYRMIAMLRAAAMNVQSYELQHKQDTARRVCEQQAKSKPAKS